MTRHQPRLHLLGGLVAALVLLALVPAVAAAARYTGATPSDVVRASGALGPGAGHRGSNPPGSEHNSGDPIVPGPCTEASAQNQFRDDDDHDHLDMEQHIASCGLDLVNFLPLTEELDDEVTGEMDVANDIAAVAVAFPQAGALFFDVSDPANPKFLSRYASSECEGLAIDVDCGAYVDLSEDGKAAYLSIQQITVVPGRPPDPQAPTPAIPGVEVIDLTDPENPELSDSVILSEDGGGVHTSRAHEIPEGFAEDANPGEYLFSIANGYGVQIYRVNKDEDGARTLDPIKLIEMDEQHDTFIQNDPIDKRVYLYVAVGLDSGFYVYDVTDPEGETPMVAEWDATPQCQEDWYSHTVDVKIVGNKRYVTLPAELFNLDAFGEQSEEDQAEGCGVAVGNGDLKAGPMWIVDATDFSKLGPPDATDTTAQEAETEEELKANSEAALVTTWTNAAGAAGGNLRFSPHNQQIVGDKIYLSNYHGGVTVLDASAAFKGIQERPNELAFAVPSGTPTRPIYDQPINPLIPFMSTFTNNRPNIWDMFFYKGHFLVADMTGGFYSYKEKEAPTTTTPPTTTPPTTTPPTTTPGTPCRDRTAPRSRVTRRGSRVTRRGISLRGTSSDVGCRGDTAELSRAGRVARVAVAVGRPIRGGRRCRFLQANGRFGAPRSCLRTQYLPATGTNRWTFNKRVRLRPGPYTIWVRGYDAAGNIERKDKNRNLSRFVLGGRRR